MMTQWFTEHMMLFGVLAAASTLLLLLSIVATPWMVARLPEDYLLQRERMKATHPGIRIGIDILRTMLGFALFALGIVMLVVPGPGLITVLLGLSVARFPGKHRLLRYVASRDSVFNSLNWMRRRHGKPPLVHPHDDKP